MTTTTRTPRLPLNVLTHSSEATFKACPKRFFYRYRLGLVPTHDSNALRLGTAFHAGLEVLKKLGTADEAERVVRDLYEAADCPPWLTTDEFDVERETASTLVRSYARRYANDLIVDYVAVEITFDLPIKHPLTGRTHDTLRNSGKIDGIARLPDGRLAIVEHKTTGEAIDTGSDYWRRLQLDSQISRYFIAAREIGYDVQTVVYDVVRKPSIRPKAVVRADQARANADGHYFGVPLRAGCPDRETPVMYAARLAADMRDRPDFYFARNEVARLDSDLEEFAAEEWQIAQQIGSSERYGRYYRNTSACSTPFRCTYLDICRGFAGDPEQTIPDGFKIAELAHPELSTSQTEIA